MISATELAGRAVTFSRFAYAGHAVLVNGTAGLLSTADGEPRALMSFTIAAGRIVGIDILADPERLRRLDVVER